MDTNTAWETLRDFAEGRIEHINAGSCPDCIEGFGKRDMQCPVCRALDTIAGAAPAAVAGPAREEIAALREEHGITSTGRGIKEFEQVDTFVRAVLQRWGAAPALEAPAAPEPVGEAGTMPGTSGFTMACFHADKVPLSTKLYTQPMAAAPQAPAAPILGDAERLAAARQDKTLADYWRKRVAGLAEEFATAEASRYLADRIVADLYDLPLAGVARPAAPAAPAVDADPLGLRDVGEAFMQAIERNSDALKAVGWLGPMDCPSEIVVDLLNIRKRRQPLPDQEPRAGPEFLAVQRGGPGEVRAQDDLPAPPIPGPSHADELREPRQRKGARAV
ncbi:hypothetical protein ABN448_09320 [Delftia acidovorans]|uniref:hypothetical protein n=1 Tax=Delftia acidovorans TaxID=80866 RepID=UPI0032DE7BAE